ncbi:MAG TPA: hypothetical protein VFY29_07905, partial [Terriglobia bacterium]|nr:hypothetical protein [Terriglobia bacterium]
LCEGFRSIGAIPAVFSTDWAVSWPFSLAGETPSEAVDFAAETWRPQSGGDFLERARSVAQAVRAFQPDIVFYHSSFFEQITARVAAFRPAPWQFHINHGEEMPVDFFAGRAHRQARALAATRYREVSAPWVPMACDIATRLADEPAVTRQAIGVDTASSVSATFGDLDQAGSPEFVSALTEILMRFPEHTHLFAGSGNVRTLRQALHAEGVLARVRFLGPVVNAASLMPSIDFYLAPFPHMDSEFVMDALGAGKPVLMHKEATDPRTGAESSLVGIDDLLASNRSAYVEAASVLIRKPPVRARLTHEVRSRFEAEYSPRRVAERYLEFIETLSAR